MSRTEELQAQLATVAPIPEPAERMDAPAAADAQPYVTDGVVFTSYASHTLRSSRTGSIARFFCRLRVLARAKGAAPHGAGTPRTQRAHSIPREQLEDGFVFRERDFGGWGE